MLASDLELLRRKGIAKKEEDKPLESHPTHFPGEYGDRECQDWQQQHNFYNVYLLITSEYLELIHCLNELNFA